MKTIDEWFSQYAESHQNQTNKAIHWVCVPLIFWSVMALLWSIPVPEVFIEPGLNWMYIALMGALGWYMFLAPPLAVGMLLICYGFIYLISFVEKVLDESGLLPLWGLALLVFIVAWIGQFIGHKVEGKKPSFLTDLTFLLIGPIWLLHFIYKKIGIRYQ
ncbi:MAG: DUF962 domain-containing protein [Bacteroidia bacterium]|jgi:uncharacterized membrane protein YGL010W|nr:DUF962 domain-containing protein [Bacteroidia bacterium]MCC6768243.1 DUF962 domain-containing protein [Bacteroidia bacterium]